MSSYGERRMGMSFCLRPNVCKKCGKPLGVFDGQICAECQKPCRDCKYNHTSICGNCKHYDEFEEKEVTNNENSRI